VLKAELEEKNQKQLDALVILVAIAPAFLQIEG